MKSRTASRRLGTALLALSLLATMGCATRRYDARGHPYYEPPDRTHTTRGAILGGLAGAGVGRMIAGHHHDEAGYWLGGALGLLTGAAIGDAMDRDRARRDASSAPYPYPHPHPEAPAPGPDDPPYDDGGYDDDAYGPRDEYEGWEDAYEPPPTPEPRILDLPDEVLFGDGSDRLEPGGERRLRSLVTALRRHPGTVAVVRGHASQREQDPPDLSEARAHAVRSFLLHQGIAPSRVTALGMGARFPVASDRTPEGQQRNRRVEIEVRTDRGHEQAGLW